LAFGNWPLAIDFFIVTSISVFHQIGDEQKLRPEYQVFNFKLITER
jgi:hypothetical protein